jgi:hypothetical protein
VYTTILKESLEDKNSVPFVYSISTLVLDAKIYNSGFLFSACKVVHIA